MRRIYEPGAYGPEADAGNFWRMTVPAPADLAQLDGDADCDVAVIGAGVTGLNAALSLAGDHGMNVMVLDAETPGFGASGRNGGFVCLGGARASHATIARRHGAAEAANWRQAERAAVDHVAALLEAHGIDADRHSDGETLLAHGARDWPDLIRMAQEAQTDYGITPELLPREALAERGMASPEFHGALTLPVGFAINPLKYTTGLVRAARAAGARVYANTPVQAIASRDGAHRLRTPGGTVTARRMILAMNGYASEDTPRWMAGRYLPVQSAILVSRPLTGAELQDQGWTSAQMCYDTRRLLHYFRLMPDNRMLFGMRGGTAATPSAFAALRHRMRADFDRFFPAWRAVDTPHFWTGLVCMTRTQTPFVGPLEDCEGAFAAFGFHGNGVAMGSYAGRLLADLVSGTPTRYPFPAFLRRTPRRFRTGRFRRALLRPAIAAYSLQDLRRSS